MYRDINTLEIHDSIMSDTMTSLTPIEIQIPFLTQRCIECCDRVVMSNDFEICVLDSRGFVCTRVRSKIVSMKCKGIYLFSVCENGSLVVHHVETYDYLLGR